MKFSWKKSLALAGAAIMSCALVAGCSGRPTGEVPVDASDDLKECVVRLALPTNTDPYDWEYVQDEINYQLDADGKPYTVSLEFLDETDYSKNILTIICRSYPNGCIPACEIASKQGYSTVATQRSKTFCS